LLRELAQESEQKRRRMKSRNPSIRPAGLRFRFKAAAQVAQSLSAADAAFH
jgi:hypothetical protein